MLLLVSNLSALEKLNYCTATCLFVIMKTQRAKLENVKLREDLNKQNKKLEEMFEVLQKQIQNLARNLDKQVVDDQT